MTPTRLDSLPALSPSVYLLRGATSSDTSRGGAERILRSRLQLLASVAPSPPLPGAAERRTRTVALPVHHELRRRGLIHIAELVENAR